MEKSCMTCKFEDLEDSKEPCASCLTAYYGTGRERHTMWEEKSDAVNHPSHYQGKHECIDEMIALFGVEAVKAFCKCNVYKYRFRAANKNGQEDLDKADWYMDKLIELEGGKANGNLFKQD